MPYIKDKRRIEIDDFGSAPNTSGELNYKLTQDILDYLVRKDESYQTYNDIIGALEGAKLELYRRKIAPYEYKKMKENGDMY